MEAIGPLQLRVMRHIWKGGATTVHAARDALNGDHSVTPLAYTTVLTVMRNLSRRNMLNQARGSRGSRSHVFKAIISEVEYKWKIIHQISHALFNDDLTAMAAFLREPEVKPTVARVRRRKAKARR